MALKFKKSQAMCLYESIIIMNPTALEEEQKALFKKNKEIIQSFGGSVYSVEIWGKRPLANHIKKHQMGTYFHSYFTAGPDVIVELERTMKNNEKVLRYMHSGLNGAQSIEKHAENFKQILKESTERVQEAELRMQKKRAARTQRGSNKGRESGGNSYERL